MKRIQKLFFLALVLSFISCDKEVGIDGVVIDAVTNMRLANVTVNMTSEQGDKSDQTKNNGYFNTQKSFSCGIASCNTDFKITFLKEGYEAKSIDQSIFNSDDENYLNSKTRDTLIVKLYKKT